MGKKKQKKIPLWPQMWDLEKVSAKSKWDETRSWPEYKEDYKSVYEATNAFKRHDKTLARRMKDNWGFWPLRDPENPSPSSEFKRAFENKCERLERAYEKNDRLLAESKEAWDILRKVPKCKEAFKKGLHFPKLNPDTEGCSFDFYCHYSSIVDPYKNLMRGVIGGEWLMIFEKNSDGEICDGNDDPLECQERPETIDLTINLGASVDQILKDVNEIVLHWRKL